MLSCAILTAITVGLIILAIYLFTKLDCDLELLFYSKFGRSIDKFSGKVVWITGASSGVGEHLAYVLAEAGAKLVLSARSKDQLNRVAQECISKGNLDPADVLVLQFDMTDFSCHQEKFDQVLAHFGKLDILVNNAGRSQRAFFQDIDLEVDRAIFDVNVFSLVSLTRVALRYFLEKNTNGQIAITSSTAGIMGAPFSASYTGSKHALHGYFECLRMELGTKGISVQMLCLGPIFSNIVSNAFTGKLGQKFDKQHEANSRRMSTERCAELYAVAVINKLDEAWISIQPVLALHYFSQYLPSISRKLMPRFFTIERANRLREGR